MPIMPAQAPNTKYRVPMSLWLVEKNQRVMVTGRMAESKAADCSSVYKGSNPFPIISFVVYYTLDCKSKDAG